MILQKRQLAPEVWSMVVEAPYIARAAMPGQFLIVIADEKGERIPLTICDFDKEAGTVTIVIQAVGLSTQKMVGYSVGNSFSSLVGPLGHPSEFCSLGDEELQNKTYCFVAGGIGAAPVLPQVKWLSDKGIEPHVIIGARSSDLIILEDEFRELTSNVHITTDDGSGGDRGLVTTKLEELIDNGTIFDEVVAIGPLVMMKFVAISTKKYGIKTTVSLNTIMVDGTGMCGACRVTVGDTVRFACVEGPEFDGHLVDFDEAIRRGTMYRKEENHRCNLRHKKIEKDGAK